MGAYSRGGNGAWTFRLYDSCHQRRACLWAALSADSAAHPDAERMSEVQIAQSFAEAITAAVYIERNPQHGQIVREIVGGVSRVVERTAGENTSFSPLFRFESGKGLLPTGNRPTRPGFRAADLIFPESIFRGA